MGLRRQLKCLRGLEKPAALEFIARQQGLQGSIFLQRDLSGSDKRQSNRGSRQSPCGCSGQERRKDIRMHKTALALIAVAGLALGACSNMSSQQQRMLSGGAGGAAAGAGIGALTGGSATTGALIGGAAGTAGGYLYDRYED